MRHFLRETQSLSAEYPSEFSEYFLPLISQRKCSGSVAETLSTEYFATTTPSLRNDWTIETLHGQLNMPKNYSRYTLTVRESENLLNLLFYL